MARFYLFLIIIVLGSNTLLLGKQTLKWGVFAYSTEAVMRKQYQPVIDYLNAHLRDEKVELVLLNREELEAALEHNVLDMITTNPSQFEVIRNHNMFIRTIATTKKVQNGTVTDSFGGVIFTRSGDEDVNTIEDLESSLIASSDIKSLGAYQAQVFEFLERGIDITKNLVPLKTHDEIIRSVVDGSYEAGFVRTGMIELEIANGRLKADDIKIINAQKLPQYPYLLSTRLYPEWPVAILPNISDKKANEITILLLQFSPSPDHNSSIYGFSLPQNYTSIEHLAKTLKLPPYDIVEEVNWEQIYTQYRTTIIIVGFVLLLIVLVIVKIISLNIKIRSNEERFKLAMEGTKDGLFDWNMNNNSMFHSKHFETMLGYSGSELPQTVNAWSDLLHPDDVVAAYEKVNAYLETKGKGSYVSEFRMRTKEGSWRWIEGRGKALFNTKGKPVRFIGFNTDVTTKKENEKQLVLQTKHAQMGEMIGMIAHQWRQPLAAISATVSSLQVQQELHGIDEKDLAASLITIEELTQHLSKTINDFRNFFKEDKDKMAVDLGQLVEDSINIINPILKVKKISLRVECLCKEEIITYPNEIKQVLLNILKNAQDIIEERKTPEPLITIRAYQENDKYCISIEDNAGGIPETIMDRIFEPYYTTKDTYNGTGLGLYMSKTIVHQHCKGTLEASNTDAGALFVLRMNKSIE